METKQVNNEQSLGWIRLTSLKYSPEETKVVLSLRAIQEVQELPDGKGCFIRTDGNNEHLVSESMEKVTDLIQMAMMNIRRQRA